MRGNRSTTRGLTLVEAIIAGALLAVFLGVVSSVLTSYLRAYHQLDQTQPSLRSLAHGVEVLGRILGSCQTIESPPLDELEAGHIPVWGKTTPLTVVYLGPSGQLERSSFAYDESRGGVVQVDHPMSDSSHSEGKDGELGGRLIARSAGFYVRLELRRSVPLAVFRLQAAAENRVPLQTAVRLSSRVLASPQWTP